MVKQHNDREVHVQVCVCVCVCVCVLVCVDVYAHVCVCKANTRQLYIQLYIQIYPKSILRHKKLASSYTFLSQTLLTHKMIDS